MQLNPTEITALIKERIQKSDLTPEIRTEGSILSIADGIIRIEGLSKALQGEVLDLPANQCVGAQPRAGLRRRRRSRALAAPVEGDTVKSTGRVLDVPIGEALLGRVVNALGEPIDGKGPIATTERSPIEKIGPRRHQPRGSRATAADRAQDHRLDDPHRPRPARTHHRRRPDRQDRHCPRLPSSTRRPRGVKCIYVAIGQKQSSISAFVRRLEDADALKHTIVVVASASESAALQYIAPYRAAPWASISATRVKTPSSSTTT